uniref:Uncharacterized protein n=1 Tax=Antirrhinum hispanicum TaxID=49039 RepID=Q9AXC6_ANTHI|nr:hypothetical protein [Antirrhinum hispanicum]
MRRPKVSIQNLLRECDPIGSQPISQKSPRVQEELRSHTIAAAKYYHCAQEFLEMSSNSENLIPMPYFDNSRFNLVEAMERYEKLKKKKFIREVTNTQACILYIIDRGGLLNQGKTIWEQMLRYMNEMEENDVLFDGLNTKLCEVAGVGSAISDSILQPLEELDENFVGDYAQM